MCLQVRFFYLLRNGLLTENCAEGAEMLVLYGLKNCELIKICAEGAEIFENLDFSGGL